MIIYRLENDRDDFLLKMLYQAIFVPPGQQSPDPSIVMEPALQRYVTNWDSRSGDIAFVAISDDSHVGAIWGRFFQSPDVGYGYVSDDIPEIAMAVQPGYRGIGIGSQLLHAIIGAYIKYGAIKISLSVDERNPAVRLYERNGFVELTQQNHSLTMVRDLSMTREAADS